jgi:tetratricopeptide (TPR) repeat protein
MENCKAQARYFEKIHELLKTKKDKCELKGGQKIDNADELLEKEFTIAARQHFDKENDPCYEMLARQMLKFLPNSVEALNAMSVVHLLQKSDSAIVYLEKAHKLNPSDCIVIHNIAEFYKRKGNQKKHEEYTMKEALMCRQK